MEGQLDVALLHSLIQRACHWRGSKLILELIGSGLDDQAQNTLIRTAAVDVTFSEGFYHDIELQPCLSGLHAAVVLNGGVDNSFHSWAPTIQLLCDQQVPSAFTGYSIDALGCERMLRALGADIVLPTAPNPFRMQVEGVRRAPDVFIVAMFGRSSNDTVDLLKIHRQERLDKLEELVKLNILDGCVSTAEKLQELRQQLLDNSVVIPEDITHGPIEKWAQGKVKALW